MFSIAASRFACILPRCCGVRLAHSMSERCSHFEFFGLPIDIDVDVSSLQRKYHSMQQQHHPDQGVSTSDGVSAHCNEAYETLKDPFRRCKYLVEILNLSSGRMPSEFLAEILELNESLDAIDFTSERGAQELSSLVKELKSRDDQLYSETRDAFKSGDRDRFRDSVNRWTYVHNLLLRSRELS